MFLVNVLVILLYVFINFIYFLINSFYLQNYPYKQAQQTWMILNWLNHILNCNHNFYGFSFSYIICVYLFCQVPVLCESAHWDACGGLCCIGLSGCSVGSSGESEGPDRDDVHRHTAGLHTGVSVRAAAAISARQRQLHQFPHRGGRGGAEEEGGNDDS